MKEKHLKMKQALKKTIVLPGLVSLIIAAQTIPVFSSLTNSELCRFSEMIDGYTIEVQAATQAENQDELTEEYGELKRDETTPDHLYTKTSAIDGTGDWYATVMAYKNPAKTREAVLDYLGTDVFLSKSVANSPWAADGASLGLANTLKFDMLRLGSKLTKPDSRKKLALIGEDTTDFIDASSSTAPEETILFVYGVINDDFGLVKYAPDKNVSREVFYTMLDRFGNVNAIDSNTEKVFQDNNKFRKAYAEVFGKDYKYRNFVYNAVNYNDGSFVYEDVNKPFVKAGITNAEMYAMIGEKIGIANIPSYKKMKADLCKAFSDISEKNFAAIGKGGNLNKNLISERECVGIWSCWKTGVLKSGKLNMKGKVTYKKVAKALVQQSIKAGKKNGTFGKDIAKWMNSH